MVALEILTGEIRDFSADAIIYVAGTALPGSCDYISPILKEAGFDTLTLEGGTPGEAALAENSPFAPAKLLWTSGPIWREGTKEELRRLTDAYRVCLELAERLGLATAVISAIPSATYDAFLFQAAKTALQAAREFLGHDRLRRISIICRDDTTAMVYKQTYNFWFADVKEARIQHPGWD